MVRLSALLTSVVTTCGLDCVYVKSTWKPGYGDVYPQLCTAGSKEHSHVQVLVCSPEPRSRDKGGDNMTTTGNSMISDWAPESGERKRHRKHKGERA